MQLRHVLATTDHSDLSARNVLVTGFHLARRAAARLTVLTVVEREDQFREASERLDRWVESVRSSSDDAVTLKLAARTGIPGVEICRFAE